MARVKYYDQASQEWKYADAALNMKGKDGYTPQKGIDYFTEEDVRELTGNVLDQGVLTYNEQELTEEQKAQARENIGIDQISFDKLTEDLDADGFRITNLPLPQSGSEPATKEFVENFTIEGSTYVATDDGEGNVTIRPYLADEDELVFKSHIQNQNNPHGVTAAQVGARPSDWIPTAEEVKARPDTWMPTAAQVGAATPEAVNSAKTTAINESKTYTNEQVKKAAPRNLLDNSDFRNPVNQRGIVSGETHETWEHTLDRWRTMNDEVTITFNGNNGVSFSGLVAQYIDRGTARFNGKKMTAVCMSADGSYGIVNFTVSETSVWTSFGADHFDAGFIQITGSSDGSLGFTFYGDNIIWVAIYEGEYTIDTLPEYQPKGYAVELAECQRYFYRLPAWSHLGGGCISYDGTTVDILVPVGVMMRKHPSVAENIPIYLRIEGDSYGVSIPNMKPTAYVHGNTIKLTYSNVFSDTQRAYKPLFAIIGETPFDFNADQL